MAEQIASKDRTQTIQQ